MANHEKESESKSKVQGEGDYEAARRYRKDVKDFVEQADIDKAAREAAPRSPEEQKELDEAERAGRSHAKDEAASRQKAADRSKRPDKS
jgi:uncharacterized protein involved in copper resistance